MPAKPEIRKDYIQDRYVIIAPRRAKRPRQFHSERPVCVNPPTKEMTSRFTPEALRHEKALAIWGKEPHWQIKVVRNIYPVVAPSFPKAYGHHEVVVETPDPHPEIEDLPTPHIAKIFEIYAERTRALRKDKKIEYILIFKNNGGTAGASLQHSHSQIFATNFMPPHLLDKSQKQQEYKLKTGHCAYCDVIRKEMHGPRKVYVDKHTLVFCPYASQHNYEVWIMPRRHIDNITLLNDAERLAWAKILKRVLKKISGLGLPYNFYFHEVVNDEDQHLYLKIVPRGSVWAGVEIGSGVVINPIPPEDAAKYYRK